MASPKEWDLTVTGVGERLDRYVAESCPGLSRTQAQKLISDGLVTVNGAPAKVGLKLVPGDRVRVTIPPPASSHLEAEAIPVAIVYEDNDVLVISKPSGLIVHPAPGHPSGTLVNAVLSHLAEPEEAEEYPRPGIVHRLDKDASGLMVVAKTAQAQDNLIGQFKARTVLKVYRVLVRGNLTPDDGLIEAPIGRDSADRKRMAVVAESRGREARTRYHVLRRYKGYTLLEVKLETGRTHQIRVHLAAIGHPVAGDRIYGVKHDAMPRLFLHAYRLGFKLPTTGEYKEFTSDLPPELERILEELG
jgi:23S rRNA pseudouridine1911/1915/1917 synthase